MRFLSVCSGIEAASVAWNPLGWKAVGFSEIEPFPCAVLQHHYPDVPNHGDMTKFKDWRSHGTVDLLCGGTPCQSFSVAGLRRGLDDPRGNLMLTFGAIAAQHRPRWLVWENVPGVLSSDGGRDFGAFLGLLGFIGYGFAYRVLDAQYFGLAQRRKRVFVVGCLGDWRRAVAVLFERHSLSGHPAPSRGAGQKVAGCFDARTNGGGFPGTDGACGGHVQPVVGPLTLAFGGNRTSGPIDITPALLAQPGSGWKGDFESETFILPFDTTQVTSTSNRSRPAAGDPCHPLAAGAHPPAIAFTGKDYGGDAGLEISPTLRAMGHGDSHANGGGQVSVCFTGDGVVADPVSASEGKTYTHEGTTFRMHNCVGDVAYTTKLHNTQSNQSGKVYEEYTTALDHNSPPPALLTAMQVRRLTPEECEALQGFPAGYTDIPWRGKPAGQCPDGPRYKALGNSWATNCARWVGERIAKVDQL